MSGSKQLTVERHGRQTVMMGLVTDVGNYRQAATRLIF